MGCIQLTFDLNKLKVTGEALGKVVVFIHWYVIQMKTFYTWAFYTFKNNRNVKINLTHFHLNLNFKLYFCICKRANLFISLIIIIISHKGNWVSKCLNNLGLSKEKLYREEFESKCLCIIKWITHFIQYPFCTVN